MNLIPLVDHILVEPTQAETMTAKWNIIKTPLWSKGKILSFQWDLANILIWKDVFNMKKEDLIHIKSNKKYPENIYISKIEKNLIDIQNRWVNFHSQKELFDRVKRLLVAWDKSKDNDIYEVVYAISDRNIAKQVLELLFKHSKSNWFPPYREMIRLIHDVDFLESIKSKVPKTQSNKLQEDIKQSIEKRINTLQKKQSHIETLSISKDGKVDWSSRILMSDCFQIDWDTKTIKHIDLSSSYLGLPNSKYDNLIPPQIFDAENVEILDLGSNYIHAIDDRIGDLIHLKALLLHKTYVRSLPASLLELKNLRLLVLSNYFREDTAKYIQKALPNCNVVYTTTDTLMKSVNDLDNDDIGYKHINKENINQLISSLYLLGNRT